MMRPDEVPQFPNFFPGLGVPLLDFLLLLYSSKYNPRSRDDDAEKARKAGYGVLNTVLRDAAHLFPVKQHPVTRKAVAWVDSGDSYDFLLGRLGSKEHAAKFLNDWWMLCNLYFKGSLQPDLPSSSEPRAARGPCSWNAKEGGGSCTCCLPDCCLPAFTDLLPLPGKPGCFSGRISGFDTFVEHVLRPLQEQTGTNFSVTCQRPIGPAHEALERVYSCQFGGKPRWNAPGSKHARPVTRKGLEHRGHVSWHCGCPAYIELRMNIKYAMTKGIHQPCEPDSPSTDVQPRVQAPSQSQNKDAPSTSDHTGCQTSSTNNTERKESTDPNEVIQAFFCLHHENHPALDFTRLPLDRRLADKIQELTRAGGGLQVIKTQLKQLSDAIISEGNLSVDPEDPRFFPSDPTINYHRRQAFLAHRLASRDHVAVELFVQLQHQTRPQDAWYFRKEDRAAGQEMLLVCQTKEQREMLARYGSDCVNMDSTYKTTMWCFPLFQLTVVDNNRRGFPVALFMVQREDAGTIAEALRLIQQWTPRWTPKVFMIDKSKAEENALRLAFGEDIQILLCAFHRLQAWHRYIISSNNNVPKHMQGQLFQMLWRVGEAGTEAELELRLEALQDHPAYSDNDRIKHWFETEWLRCKELWVACYRRGFHGAQDTNNVLEAMNRTIKHKWLDQRPDTRMDSLLGSYILDAVPHFVRQYRRMQLESISWAEQVREVTIPSEFEGRPRAVVEVLMSRSDEGKAVNPDTLKPAHDRHGTPIAGRFFCSKSAQSLHQDIKEAERDGLIAKDSGWLGLLMVAGANPRLRDKTGYFIDMVAGTCTCPDFEFNRHPCKRIFAVLHHVPGWHFERLPQSLLGQPRLTLDTSVLPSSAQPQESGVNPPEADDPVVGYNESDVFEDMMDTLVVALAEPPTDPSEEPQQPAQPPPVPPPQQQQQQHIAQSSRREFMQVQQMLADIGQAMYRPGATAEFLRRAQETLQPLHAAALQLMPSFENEEPRTAARTARRSLSFQSAASASDTNQPAPTAAPNLQVAAGARQAAPTAAPSMPAAAGVLQPAPPRSPSMTTGVARAAAGARQAAPTAAPSMPAAAGVRQPAPPRSPSMTTGIARAAAGARQAAPTAAPSMPAATTAATAAAATARQQAHNMSATAAAAARRKRQREPQPQLSGEFNVQQSVGRPAQRPPPPFPPPYTQAQQHLASGRGGVYLPSALASSERSPVPKMGKVSSSLRGSGAGVQKVGARPNPAYAALPESDLLRSIRFVPMRAAQGLGDAVMCMTSKQPIKQGTAAWHAARSCVSFTASSLGVKLGFHSTSAASILGDYASVRTGGDGDVSRAYRDKPRGTAAAAAAGAAATALCIAVGC